MEEADVVKDEQLSIVMDTLFNAIHKRMSELLWQKEGECFDIEGMSSRKFARHLALACLTALVEETEKQG